MNRLMLKHPNKDMYAFFLSKLYDKAIFMFYNSRKKAIYYGTEVVKGVYKEQVNDCLLR